VLRGTFRTPLLLGEERILDAGMASLFLTVGPGSSSQQALQPKPAPQLFELRRTEASVIVKRALHQVETKPSAPASASPASVRVGACAAVTDGMDEQERQSASLSAESSPDGTPAAAAAAAAVVIFESPKSASSMPASSISASAYASPLSQRSTSIMPTSAAAGSPTVGQATPASRTRLDSSADASMASGVECREDPVSVARA